MKPLEKRRKLSALALQLLAAQVLALLWIGALAARAQEPPPMDAGPDQGPPPEQEPVMDVQTNVLRAPEQKPAEQATTTPSVVVEHKPAAIVGTNQSMASEQKPVASATTNPPVALGQKPARSGETNHQADAAQEPAAVTGNGQQAFKIIYERNIFNPNRGPRYSRRNAGDAPKPVKVEGFSLVGTLMSEKGNYAFFDGSEARYRAALQTSNNIAGYTVAAITPNFVTLRSPSNAFDLTMNMQMRKQEEGDWELTEAKGSWNSTNSASSTNATAAVSDEEGGNDPAADEVMKRLMKKREEELKK
jgi:hypothetical protein